MAKQGKVLPARKSREEESLLLRSAESLGRMIGSLQRQLEDATRNISFRSATTAGDGSPRRGNASTKSGNKSGVMKVRSTADRKSKRAAKSAGAKKTAPRHRSGANRRSRRTTRHA